VLLEHHRRLLVEASGIAPDVVGERGYWSATTKDELAALGFKPAQRRVPALVLPKYTTAGVNGLHEIRPDTPRVQQRDGKPRAVKYDVPAGSKPTIDVHPRTVPVLGDPAVRLLIGEGIRKGDAALSHGFHCLNVSGVFNWRGTGARGGKRTLADFDDIALNGGRRVDIVFDSDGAQNTQVQQGAKRLREALLRRGARAVILFLPPGLTAAKVGLDDFLAAGGDLDTLLAEAEATESGVLAAAVRRYHLTDYGNAERLVAQHRDDIRYSYVADSWYVWSGSHWTDESRALIKRRAKETVRRIYREVELAASDDEATAIVKHASRSEAAERLNALVALAQSEPGIPVAPTEFDTDPFLLNVANGTIDLRTGELRPHRRTDLISKVIPLAYDPDARCPRWEQFIAEITANRPALGGFIQRAIGYCLTGDTRERAFFVGYGHAKAGKTTFYETIAAMLGPYAAHTAVQTLLTKRDQDRPANELAALRGTRFVSASEPAEGARLDVALVKALAGQDPITARFLFKEFFTYRPAFKVWLLTNHKPIIRETHQAIWDRVKLIPFDVRFYGPDDPDAPTDAPRQDPALAEVLRGELPGILNWAIAGCLLWQRDGLGVPEEVRAATAAYRTEMDILGAFLVDRCVVAEGARATAATLYAAYASWCETSGEDKKSKIDVGKALAERGFVAKRVGKANIDTWFGVGLRDENARSDDPEGSPDGGGAPQRRRENRTTTPKTERKHRATLFPSDPKATPNFGKFATRREPTKPFRKTGSPSVATQNEVADGPNTTYPRQSASPPSSSPTGSISVAADANRVADGFSVLRITTDAELAAMLPELLTTDVLGLDVETSGLDPRADRLCLVQFATDERVLLIDAAAIDLAPLAALFTGDGPTLVGHNLTFDLAFLHAAELPIPDGERLFDTLLASQVLDGGAHLHTKVPDPAGALGRGGTPATIGYHALAAVAHRWLDRVLDKAQQVSDWSGALTDEQLAYAARDAAVLLPLRDALDAALAAQDLTPVAALEFAALPAVVWMECAGVPFDVADWTALRDAAAATVAAVDAELAKVLPGVNVDSPAQVIQALAELDIALPNAQETTLRTVVDQHPAVGLVLQRKDAKKRVSTYGDTYLRHVDPITGRLHASYRLIGAASGRMACGQPNLQNIPRDPAYRRCIRPGDGRVLVKADYAQIELRIAAQITGDQAMRAAFRAGDDLHEKTARAVLGRTPTTRDRQLAKALNFGLLYGMGAATLQTYARDDYGVQMTAKDAVRFREAFFATYAGIRRWHRSHHDGAITTTTALGRVRREVARFSEKLASPISGTGADILKRALARLWEHRAAVPSAVPILAVHDEIVVEVDAADAEHCAAWLTAHMTATGAELLPDVPVEVEANIVADWSGAPMQGSTP
jgi:P4 family phage/plasmid primase-like protien